MKACGAGVIYLFLYLHGHAWATPGHAHQHQSHQQRARGLLAIPPYQHGAEYQYILSEVDRENGMSYLPASERLRIAVDKIKRGIPIRFATVGASIMAGQGTGSGPSLPGYITLWLKQQFPGLVNCSNGAVGGTTSEYLSVCHNMHVPIDADIIIVEFSISDGYGGDSVREPFRSEARRAFERLIRKLLSYPNRPAIILLHAYAWHQLYPFAGSYWSNSERDFGEFERYYHLPSVSVKAACFQYMRDNVEGFMTEPRRFRNDTNGGTMFYFDQVHPDELTGCRVMAELVFHIFTKVLKGLAERPLADAERVLAAAPLPPPMISGNYEAKSTRCFIGGSFTAAVYGTHPGWEWINESKSMRPKWGYISSTPGSTIRLKLDTRASKALKAQAGRLEDEDKALVQLSHLRSYENMGQALVTCEGGCNCTATILQGHHDLRNSLSFLHEFFTTMAEECIVAVTVMDSSKSGGRKVKLIGVVVSEVAGKKAVHENLNAAMEYVGDIHMRGGGKGFDLKDSI